VTVEAGSPAGTLAAPQPPRPAAPRPRRGPAPWWLWVPTALVLLPALVPFAGLLGRVFGAGGDAVSIAVSERTARLIWNTVVLIGLVTAAAAVIGVAAAWLTERTTLAGRSVWRVIAALPLVIPSYVVGMAFVSAFGPTGLITSTTGIPMPRMTGLAGAWVAVTISTYPFVYLTVRAALRRLDPAHEEAARGLGASPSRVFRTVVVPQLRPALGAGLLLVALYTLSDVGAVSLARYDAFTRVIYAQYAGRLDRTPAAVLAVVLVLIALVLVWAERGTRGRAAYYSRSVSRPPRLVPLGGGATAGATVFFASLAAVSLGVPIVTLVSWVARAGTAITIPWGAMAGSLSGSALAAVVAAAAALPAAVLVARHPSRPTAWAERLAYTAFALPHITVALGMVFFASRFLGGLYQSLTLLVLVYASIFFAQALGPVRASIMQQSPSLEQASRSLGMGPLRTFGRVTVPLARRGLLTGALLVFLTAMKELPATLLLRPTGFDTLAVRIWSAADGLLYSRAAVAALLLLVVSAVPMYLLTTRDR
jgi:iron(III) transport system permease protein